METDQRKMVSVFSSRICEPVAMARTRGPLRLEVTEDAPIDDDEITDVACALMTAGLAVSSNFEVASTK